MLPQTFNTQGPITNTDSLFLYIWKTIVFLEELVREGAAAQKIPIEILRVLKECRVCIIVTEDTVFCVLAYCGENDTFRTTIHTEDYAKQRLSVKEAEKIGVKRIFSSPPIADPLTLSFPIECLEALDEKKRVYLIPLVNKYLIFEVSWAKQRGIIKPAKPFFPGTDFVVDKRLVFVLMPFTDKANEIYDWCIKPIVQRHVSKCLKADDIFHTGSIIEVIWENINRAKFIIADLTDKNPNVFYEVGIAHTVGKEVILLAQKEEDVPFDLRHLNIIFYSSSPRGIDKLKSALDDAIKSVLDRDQIQAMQI